MKLLAVLRMSHDMFISLTTQHVTNDNSFIRKNKKRVILKFQTETLQQ